MNIVFLFLTVFLLALLQSSFFIHFPVLGIVFNFLLLFVFAFVLLEDHREKSGFYIAAFSGFWFDIFSTMPVGTYIITFLILTYLFKKTLKRYVSLSVS